MLVRIQNVQSFPENTVFTDSEYSPVVFTDSEYSPVVFTDSEYSPVVFTDLCVYLTFAKRRTVNLKSRISLFSYAK